jgi:hypothetical protein
VQIVETAEDRLPVPSAGTVQIGQVVEQPDYLSGCRWRPAGRPCGAGLPELEDPFASRRLADVGIDGISFARCVSLPNQPSDMVGEPPSQCVVSVRIAEFCDDPLAKRDKRVSLL